MSRTISGAAANIATDSVIVPSGATATKLVDARPGRESVKLHLSNSGTNATFYIGPTSGVDGSNGFHMYLGDYLEIQTEAEIWGIWPNGSGSIAVGVLEVYD